LRRLTARESESVDSVVLCMLMNGRSVASRERKYSWVANPALPISDSDCTTQQSILYNVSVSICSLSTVQFNGLPVEGILVTD